MGVVFFVAAVGLGVHTIVGWARGVAIEGFTTVILLLLIIGAMLMFSLGILGFFIGKIYEEIKCRPPYLIQSTVNLEGEENK
jgi:dolichol-phosphate mannosyltransferase